MGNVCGEIGRLGHENEVVCIVSGGGRGMWGDRRRLGSGE